jgi:hypothetical protein
MLLACTKEDLSQDPNPTDNDIDEMIILKDTLCENSKFREDGFVYDKNNKTYLWAGIDTSTHFDITDWELNECNLRYGLGRETFPALLDPQYTPLKDYNIDLQSLEQCVVLFSSDYVKVYPYAIMTDYEVINERHNGHPIMIAYCVLADLAAVYDRDYCGVELTFAVSGYTYFDRDLWEGIDAFVLWDRDTESLWFPLIDRAISGPLKGHQLEKFNTGLWEIMSWEDIRTAYPDALVLNSGQSQLTPPKYPSPDPSIYTCQ